MPASQVSICLTAVVLSIPTSLHVIAAQPARDTGSPPSQSPAPGDELARAQAWFDSAWRDAQVFPKFAHASFAWRMEDRQTLPPDQLAALKREVAAHPEHPERDALPMLEQHAAGRPTVIRFALFSEGSDAWRYNTTFDNGEFNDAVRTPRSSWWMSRESLKVFDVREIAGDDPEQTIAPMERQFVSPVGQLLHGYMSIGRTAGLRPGRLDLAGHRWKVRTLVEDGTPAEQRLAVEFSGRWDPALARGFVERMTTVENGYRPGAVGAYHEFKGWARVEALGRWVAQSSEEHAADGSLVRAVYFEGAAELPDGGFAAVAGVPDLGKVDAIRGALKFKIAADFNRDEVRAVGEDGEIVTARLEARSGARGRSFRDRLRWLGWVMIGGVGAVGCVVMRRHSIGKTH